MKTTCSAAQWLGLCGLLLGALLGWKPAAAPPDLEDAAKPQIVSIRLDGEDIVVEVNVPKGLRRVTLESRARLGRGSWVPRQVQRLDGTGGAFTFRLKQEASLEVLRVTATEQEPLPASFYQGSRFFPGPAARSANHLRMPALFLEDSAIEVAPDAARNAVSSPTREVVESDIWKIDGDRLYFFNQLRGLQIIDISNADSPRLISTLEMPAAGEQMYLLDSEHVALLVRDTCHYFSGDAESRIVIVKLADGSPSVLSSIPVNGTIRESRLVGTALYLAAQSYHRREIIVDKETGAAEDYWAWGTMISSYDLQSPAAPVARKEHWIPGSGHAIYATADYLFVATQGVENRWWRSQVEMIDISSPDGALIPLSQIRPAGRVLDKFKMHADGSVFTVISETSRQTRATRLETYDISNPTQPRKLGSVEVGRNESLYATRFDSDKAYIVTFLRIDPLWIVDLSDPANPTISGELEVPGWSTYIQPLGDRLLSIGIDNVEGFRVAVSLFDVKDPAKPGLLSRVPLGINNSWSEANRDEKALGFVPEAGLVMIPFSSYNRNDNRTGVQLVELVGDELVLRGTIEDDVTPRRATLRQDRILSLSGKSLLTVDASDYNNPRVLSDFPLSWAVDRVFAAGNYLIELTRGNSWSGEAPAIRTAAQSKPHEILAQLNLPPLSIVGSTMRDGRLYIVQAASVPAAPFWEGTNDGEDDSPEEPAPPDNFRLSVYDVSGLPAISLLGSRELYMEGATGVNATLHFPLDDVLTISMNQNYYYFDIIRVDIFFGFPYYATGPRRLVTFNVDRPEAMSLLSDYTMETENAWNHSEVFVSGTRLYMSRQTSRFIGDILPRPAPDDSWMQQYFLDVIDFADPENPTAREPVNIPGSLVGIGRGGEILYTKAPHWNEETLETDWLEWLDASAYDGVSASLVDSIPLSSRWPHPVAVDKDVVYIGIPATNGRLREGEERREVSTLAAHRVADTGDFELISEVLLPFPVRELQVKRGLLSGQMNQELWFYNLEPPGELAAVGVGTQSNCFGFHFADADGSAESGFWVPAGDYGLSHVSLETNSERVVAVHWGVFRGADCAKNCAIRLEVRPGQISLIGGFNGFSHHNRNLSSEEWQALLDSLDVEAMRDLSGRIECPNCGDEGSEWLQVFTPQSSVRIVFPRGTEEGRILSPLAGEAAPLAEKMRAFLSSKFHWQGWTGGRRSEQPTP